MQATTKAKSKKFLNDNLREQALEVNYSNANDGLGYFLNEKEPKTSALKKKKALNSLAKNKLQQQDLRDERTCIDNSLKIIDTHELELLKSIINSPSYVIFEKFCKEKNIDFEIYKKLLANEKSIETKNEDNVDMVVEQDSAIVSVDSSSSMTQPSQYTAVNFSYETPSSIDMVPVNTFVEEDSFTALNNYLGFLYNIINITALVVLVNDNLINVITNENCLNESNSHLFIHLIELFLQTHQNTLTSYKDDDNLIHLNSSEPIDFKGAIHSLSYNTVTQEKQFFNVILTENTEVTTNCLVDSNEYPQSVDSQMDSSFCSSMSQPSSVESEYTTVNSPNNYNCEDFFNFHLSNIDHTNNLNSNQNGTLELDRDELFNLFDSLEELLVDNQNLNNELNNGSNCMSPMHNDSEINVSEFINNSPSQSSNTITDNFLEDIDDLIESNFDMDFDI